MQKQTGSTTIKEEPLKTSDRKKLIFAVVDWLSAIASVFFILGSVFYWPGVTSQDSKLGEGSFLIGSFFFLAYDLGSIYQEPESNPVNSFRNVSALVSLCCLLSDVAFIASSAIVLQEQDAEIGWILFVIACSCIIIASTMVVLALYNKNAFTAEFNKRYEIYKSDIVLSSISNSLGSFLLIGGSLIFIYGDYTEENDLIANWLFLFGTIFYLIDTFITFRTSKKMADAEEKIQKEADNDSSAETTTLVA